MDAHAPIRRPVGAGERHRLIVAKSRKTGIRLSIEQILFPELEARGFSMAADSGWGRFSRIGANGTETLTIDFDKNNLAHFRMTLGVEADATDRHVLSGKHFYLTRWGLPLRRWFGVRKKVRDGITAAEYEAAVRLAMDCLPQVERLFATGKRSWRMAEMPEPRWVGWFQMVFWGFIALFLTITLMAGFLLLVRGFKRLLTD